jgi:hypothetical protein
MGGTMDFCNDVCENMKWVYYINIEGFGIIWKLDPIQKPYHIALYIA